LENLSDGKDIYKAWENIIKNTKTSGKVSVSLHELKQVKPFDAGIKSLRATLPAGIFYWRFQILMFTLKKTYLIDSSFKFNKIEFCTLLVNWLIWVLL
jgi:putative component of toxin-antitoxin plasmid stabilization module